MAILQMLRIAVVMLVVLFFVGWLPWAAIGPLRRRVNCWFAAPFFGLAIVEVFGWYWLEWGSGGMKLGAVFLAAFWVVGAVLVVLWPRSDRQTLIPRCSSKGLWAGVVVVLGALVFSSLILFSGLKGDEPVPTWYGNADLSSYSLVSQLFVDNGHGDAGSISTADLGVRGREDAAGVYPFLALTAIVNGTGVATAAVPALGVALLLLVIASAWMLSVLVRAGPILIAGLSLLVIVPFSITFVVGHGYLAQVLSMAGAVAFGAVLLAGNFDSWRESLLVSVPAAFVIAPMLLSYPPMAAGSAVVVGGTAILVRITSFRAADWYANVLRMIRAGVPVIGSLVLAAVAIAPVLVTLIDRARALSNSYDGWPLVAMTPFEILGILPFRGMVDTTRRVAFEDVNMISPSAAQWFGQALLLLAFLGFASFIAWRLRHKFSLLPLVAGLAVLVSYGFLYSQRGISYQQWKWITFFQPLLTIAVIVAIVVLIQTALSRYPASRYLITATALGITVLVAAVSLQWDLRLWGQKWPYVTADLQELREVASSGLDQVSLEVEPFAETMWAAYYLAPLKTNFISGSYFTPSIGTSAWIVTKPEYLYGSPSQVVRINDTFVLVCQREPCGAMPVLPGK